jgi:hypothetical protein
VLNAKDDVLSLRTVPTDRALVVAPQENLVASVKVGLPLARAFSLEAEVAGSAYSEDTRSRELGEELGYELPSILTNLITPNTSTRMDAAASGSLRLAAS